MLSHDRKGFLVADSTVTTEGLIKGLHGIKRDTAMTVALLKAQLKSNLLKNARVVNPNRVHPHARQYPDGSTGSPRGEQHEAVRQITQQQAREVARQRREVETQRDHGGAGDRTRNSRGLSGAGDDVSANAARNKGEKDGIFSRLNGSLAQNSGGGGQDKVDPAIEATNELRSLVGGPLKGIGELGKAVIGRGFTSGSNNDKPVPWYRRMLVQLKLMRKEDTEFHRAELRAQREANRGGGGGGDSGIISEVLKTIFSPIGVAMIGAVVLAWKTIGGTIADGWTGLVGGMSKKWDAAVADFLGMWTPIAMFLNDKLGIVKTTLNSVGQVANSAIKTATGVDVKATANAASNAVSTAVESAKETLQKIIPGYRKKAAFTGIGGGAGLASGGTYTEDEAAKIRALKSSGANTSANLKGGMPREIQEKVIARAKAAGVDPSMMLKITAMESGGNPNAISSTGALGLNQFTGRTATSVGIIDRFDADQNIDGGIKLAQENIKALKVARLPVTPENVYMLHQLGVKGGKEVLKAAASGKSISSLSASTQSAVSKNFGAGSKTAAQYVAKNGAAMQNRVNTVIGQSTIGTVPALTNVTAVPSLGVPRNLPSMSISPHRRWIRRREATSL